jgi:prevent-host-death family protein
MTSSLSLFEAKAHLSEVVREVSSSGTEKIVTVRGKPMVRIVPYAENQDSRDVWEVRERVFPEYGPADLDIPQRGIDRHDAIFSDEL